MSCYWKYALLFVSLLRTLLGGTDLIDLSSFVSGSDQGVRLIGASDGTHSGNSVAIIGDFDADGTKDFVIGAPQTGNKGAAFIILGAALTTEIDMSSFTSGSGGMKIVGANFGDQLGYSVGAAGDVNDDGYDDCMCGAPGAGTLLRPNAGIVYMIFGKSGPYSNLILASIFAGSTGFSIVGGAAGSQLGFCTSCLRGALGDVNGDGFADFAIGSTKADYASRNEAGTVYIIYGKASTASVTSVDLASSLAGKGITIGGAAAGDHVGSAISGAGDVNDDGVHDLVIGCTGCDPEGRVDAGAAYLIYCSHSMTDIDLAEYTQHPIVRFTGASSGDLLGASVCDSADVNGDGFADLLLGAPGTETEYGVESGCVHVIYGASNNLPANFDLATHAAGPAGYTICGAEEGGCLGTAVASAGDVNQDGFDDMLLGAGGSDGAAYILPGSDNLPIFDIHLTNDTSMIMFTAPNAESGLGLSLDGGYDLTGDGIVDVLLGAVTSDPIPLLGGGARTDAGATYLVELIDVVLPCLGCPCHSCGSSPSPAPAAQPATAPSRAPTPLPGAPTRKPTAKPTAASTPILNPVLSPNNPTYKPTIKPTSKPAPTARPSREPTALPGAPTRQPQAKPTGAPTPFLNPVLSPNNPTHKPIVTPTALSPSREPTPLPGAPTRQPQAKPTAAPTPFLNPVLGPNNPTHQPTVTPTALPPSREPTPLPGAPTHQPVAIPTVAPTPFLLPIRSPSSPTFKPTVTPTSVPVPTAGPSREPTPPPGAPTRQPIAVPTVAPTPFLLPILLSANPTRTPTASPVLDMPTTAPATSSPSHTPLPTVETSSPSVAPTTVAPTAKPTRAAFREYKVACIVEQVMWRREC
jgi:hypothetical protein